MGGGGSVYKPFSNKILREKNSRVFYQVISFSPCFSSVFKTERFEHISYNFYSLPFLRVSIIIPGACRTKKEKALFINFIEFSRRWTFVYICEYLSYYYLSLCKYLWISVTLLSLSRCKYLWISVTLLSLSHAVNICEYLSHYSLSHLINICEYLSHYSLSHAVNICHITLSHAVNICEYLSHYSLSHAVNICEYLSHYSRALSLTL
jgi:hypothetical protein